MMDFETKTYIDSESEFNYVRLKGFLAMFMGFITRKDMYLLSFEDVVDKLHLRDTAYRGLHDIPIENIVGSTGRYHEFTRHFFPRSFDKRDKERWRNIYTLAVTGKGFPPIEAYKIDQVYFVQDGNHRVSVAHDLGWETIQAYITELPCSISLEPHVKPDDLLIKEECAIFLKRTLLDKTRPNSKKYIDFTAPGGYQRVLRHIKLHYQLMVKQGKLVDLDKTVGIQKTAKMWYDDVYLPIVNALQDSKIMKHFPNRSESDLYIWLIANQSELRRKHDLETLNLPQAADSFLQFLEEK